MSLDFHVVIPARLNSTRLPEKLIMDLNGVTIIERVYRRALLAEPKTVTIATDSDKIADLANAFGANVIMTLETHKSGTDRIAEAVKKAGFDSNDVIVNVQGDEPFISPLLIKQVANMLFVDNTKSMATLCWPISDIKEALNPNVVKVVRNNKNEALYFSRSLIPFNRDNKEVLSNVFKHIGIYAYRVSFLNQFVNWLSCSLETIESLEQLRALWNGAVINVENASVAPQQDINTIEDLHAAQK